MLINNPPILQKRREEFKNRPHPCLRFRKCGQKFVKAILYLCVAILATINIHKYNHICPEMTPKFICVSNPHCAYIHKSSNLSIFDHFKFFSENNFCVERKYFPKGLGSVA